jgi:hypothetical protein
MLLIFDQVAACSPRTTLAGVKLLGDGFVSLLRQWGLRPEFRREPVLAATSLPTGDSVPAFYTFGTFSPRPTALLHGLILSIAVLCAALLAMRYSWNHTVHLPFPIVDREANMSSPEREVAVIPSTFASAPYKQSPPRSASQTAQSALSRPLTTEGRFLPLPIETTLPATVPGGKVGKRMRANLDRPAHFSPVPSPLTQPSAPVTLSPHLLQLYAGTYVARAPTQLRVSVIAKDGRLQIEVAGQPRRTLQAVSETKFQAAELTDYWVEFQTNPDGTVRQLNIEQSGHRFVAVRQ